MQPTRFDLVNNKRTADALGLAHFGRTTRPCRRGDRIGQFCTPCCKCSSKWHKREVFGNAASVRYLRNFCRASEASGMTF